MIRGALFGADAKGTATAPEVAVPYPYGSYQPNREIFPVGIFMGCPWYGYHNSPASTTEIAKPAQTIMLSQTCKEEYGSYGVDPGNEVATGARTDVPVGLGPPRGGACRLRVESGHPEGSDARAPARRRRAEERGRRPGDGRRGPEADGRQAQGTSVDRGDSSPLSSAASAA